MFAARETFTARFAYPVRPGQRSPFDLKPPYTAASGAVLCGPPWGGPGTGAVGTARAALFPICWDEPGGTAVTEALTLGCPVVGYHRGCLPELVDHGRTGLLAAAGDEDDLRRQLATSQQIDPAVCAKEASERFAPGVMA